MSLRETCLLQDNKIVEAVGQLLDLLEKDDIQNSLKACIQCQNGMDRDTTVNLHGQLQSIHCILTRLQVDLAALQQATHDSATCKVGYYKKLSSARE